MPHRAKQILDAIESALSSNTDLGATVEVNRVGSLAEDQGELPALTVNYSDLPDAESDMRSWHRVLDIVLTAYTAGESESEVTAALFELQRQAHISMVTEYGLTFVWETSLGEIAAPQIQQADRTIGALTSRWFVRYIMNISDPG